MRDIKFRAWHCEYMTDDITSLTFETTNGKVTYVFIDGDCVPIDDVKLMQYTGLKDNNGKEIYESDIVKVTIDNETYGIGTVVMVLGCWSLEWIDDDEAYIEPIMTTKKINMNQDIKVIGNIYENKEIYNESN
jgi:uncharacterized phage protein (TIGR01671 family)